MNLPHSPLQTALGAAPARITGNRQFSGRSVGRFNQFQTTFLCGALVCTTMVLASSAQAQWNGLGVTGGTSTNNSDISKPENWVGGTIGGPLTVINGDFRTINTSGPIALTASANTTFTGALTFAAPRFANSTAVAISSGGSGYTSNPTATITGGTGSGVVAAGTRTSGAVSGVVFTSNGFGYFSSGALPTIAFNSVNGSGAAANFTGTLPAGSSAISISSDNGTQRTLTLGGDIIPQGRSDSSLTFGSDITVSLNGSRSVSGNSTSVAGALNQPTILTFNGPLTGNAGNTLSSGVNNQCCGFRVRS